MSIGSRIPTLAALLILLSASIAAAGWYAISEVSQALTESIRVGRTRGRLAQFKTA